MKKTLKTIAALLFISSMAMATDRVPEKETVAESSLKMGMYFDKTSGVVKTFYEKQSGKKLTIVVLDEKGHQLSKNHIGKNQKVVNLNLNLSKLEDGNYTIKATDGNEVLANTVQIEKVGPVKVKNFSMEAL